MENDLYLFETENSDDESIGGFIQTIIRKFFSLVILNLIFIFSSLLIFTVGASFTALCRVGFKIIRNQPADIFHDYFKAFIKNFKESSLCFLMQAAFLVIIIFSVKFYGDLIGRSVFFYLPLAVSVCGLLIFWGISIYLYPLLATVDIPIKSSIKNAFILCICYIKITSVCIGIEAIITAITVMLFPYSLPFAIFLYFSLIAIIIDFAVKPIIEKNVLKRSN